MPTQAADLIFGGNNETGLLPLLQTLPHPNAKDLEKQPGKYAVMDFKDKNSTIYVELKSRRIPHNRYPTAILGWNKVCEAKWREANGAKSFFCWSYQDGVFYLPYNSTLFDTFQHEEDYQRGARDDCANSVQHIVLIPHTHLIKLNKV